MACGAKLGGLLNKAGWCCGLWIASSGATDVLKRCADGAQLLTTIVNRAGLQ